MWPRLQHDFCVRRTRRCLPRPICVKRFLLGLAITGVGLPCLLIAMPYLYAVGAGTLWDRAELEVHELPPGFLGPVVILLHDSAAPAGEHRAGARLYRIPTTGVLRTRAGVTRGWRRPDFRYAGAAAGVRLRFDPRCAPVSGRPPQGADDVRICPLASKVYSDVPARAYSAYLVTRAPNPREEDRAAERFVDSVVYGKVAPP